MTMNMPLPLKRRKRRTPLDLPTICIIICLCLIVGIVFVANVRFLSTTPDVAAPPSISLEQQQHRQAHELKNNGNDKNTTTSTNSNKIVEIFRQAGVELTPEELQELPSWDDIVQLVGEEPVVHGLETCRNFRETIPAVERNLGAAGMFNTGTNLVTQLLKQNCKIPERVEKYGPTASREAHGIRWQVSWGKHTPAHFKWQHATDHAKNIQKETILPIVTIRNPYNWMASMCRNGYTAKWKHGPHQQCPHLLEKQHPTIVEKESIPNPVHVTYAEKRTSSHASLAHLWNDWNDEYLSATYPRLVVRFEDLIFFPDKMTTLICKCAGGRVEEPFTYIVNPAKTGPGHGKSTERTGMVQAWMKYGKPVPAQGGFSKSDYMAAKEFLNYETMKIFGYSHPPPIE